MARIRKGTPGRGVYERVETFSYTSVKPGLANSFTGYVAGETYWCEECHEHTEKDPGSKPCVGWLTSGAAMCRRCRTSTKKKTCLGWMPLYREPDGQPILIIIHESASDTALSLAYPDLVMVGKMNSKSSTFARKAETQIRFRTENERRKRPVDITDQLITLWNIPEFNEWLARRPDDRTPIDTPPPLRQRLSVPPPTTRVEALAIDAEKKAPSDWDSLVDKTLGRAKGRASDAEKNGDHKPNETK